MNFKPRWLTAAMVISAILIAANFDICSAQT